MSTPDITAPDITDPNIPDPKSTNSQLALICSLLLGLGIFSSCGNPPLQISQAKIVGGSTAGPVPAMASLTEGPSKEFFCGGAFIAPELVVTAAHCAINQEQQLYVTQGMKTTEELARLPRIRVVSIVVHPQYDPVNSENDIALLFLEKPLLELPPELPPSAQRHYMPINLDDQYPESVAGEHLRVVGFGRVSSLGELLLPDLREVALPIIPILQCVLLEGYNSVTDLQLCAGELETGGRDSCNGDSGGPLIGKSPDGQEMLVGIVSWGEGCGQKQRPGVYTRISRYAAWIAKTRIEYATRLSSLTNSIELKDLYDWLHQDCYSARSSMSVFEEKHSLLIIKSSYYVAPPLLPLAQPSTLTSDHCTIDARGGRSFKVEAMIRESQADLKEETPGSRVKMLVTDQQLGNQWEAEATRHTNMTLTCKDQDFTLREFDPEHLGNITLKWRDLDFGLRSLEPDTGELISGENESGTLLTKCESHGYFASLMQKQVNVTGYRESDHADPTALTSTRIVYELRVVGPLFGTKDLVYRAFTIKIDKVISFKFDSGKLLVSNLQNRDEIYSWQLVCNRQLKLIDSAQQAHYMVANHDGAFAVQFINPVDPWSNIPALSSLAFDYQEVAQQDVEPNTHQLQTNTNALTCRINGFKND